MEKPKRVKSSINNPAVESYNQACAYWEAYHNSKIGELEAEITRLKASRLTIDPNDICEIDVEKVAKLIFRCSDEVGMIPYSGVREEVKKSYRKIAQAIAKERVLKFKAQEKEGE